MRPHFIQSSRENGTPTSGTSPLASYKEVPFPPPPPRAQNSNTTNAKGVRCLEVVGERENGHARGRHPRGEGAPARRAPENRFNSHSVSADISNWSRGSRGKN